MWQKHSPASLFYPLFAIQACIWASSVVIPTKNHNSCHLTAKAARLPPDPCLFHPSRWDHRAGPHGKSRNISRAVTLPILLHTPFHLPISPSSPCFFFPSLLLGPRSVSSLLISSFPPPLVGSGFSAIFAVALVLFVFSFLPQPFSFRDVYITVSIVYNILIVYHARRAKRAPKPQQAAGRAGVGRESPQACALTHPSPHHQHQHRPGCDTLARHCWRSSRSVGGYTQSGGSLARPPHK